MPFAPAKEKAPTIASQAGRSCPTVVTALYFCSLPGSAGGARCFASILESPLPLPKHHSQTAQDLVKKSTLNPGTGGSNEKVISRKRSTGRVGLGSASGIRCRKAGAGTGICTAAASGLHLERLLCRCKRGDFKRIKPA